MGLADTRHIAKVRIHPTNPDIVWVAAFGHAFGPNSERGVYKTTNGGETWTKVLYRDENSGAIDLTVDVNNPRILYATTWEAHRKFWDISSGGAGSAVYRSKDGGDTWEDITTKPGLPSGTLGKMGITASPARPGRVWCLIQHADASGMYRSDDYGETWVHAAAAAPIVPIPIAHQFDPPSVAMAPKVGFAKRSRGRGKGGKMKGTPLY
jgi:photosystem II stability/assembly factor-like uncharacterized protein